jgi:ubiquinone/menaquinone biosynthesis C-methylase UbiE
MTDALNPQAQQMADESMVRTLAAQAAAIWPQEQPLLARYGLAPTAKVLDAGCGTGEFTSRVAARLPQASLVGVDILEEPLRLARARHASLAPRLSFQQGSLFELKFEDETFDLTACRHVLQSIPHADRALAELKRVTKRGGWVHLIAEDYGMIHFTAGALDPAQFFPAAPDEFGRSTGTDLRIGRHVVPLMQRLGFTDVTLDYVVVDTLRVPRETFADIFVAWRDGYVDPIAQHTRFTRDQARAYFDEMVACIRDPARYAVWQVPVVAGRRSE